MSPPRRSRRNLTPPALDDDSMSEIFLRLPPDDLATLVRAGAVNKRLRGIISNATFAPLYRAFHGAPPMQGFFIQNIRDDTHCVSEFVSTASSFRPPGCGNRPDWFVLDSRHGHVLFCSLRAAEEFVVCDPITDALWTLPPNPTKHPAVLLHEEEDEEFSLKWNAAVLCSKNGCDHLDCRGGPFHVVFVVSDEADGITFATVYSSVTGKWKKAIYVDHPDVIREFGHTVLAGNKVYFPCETSTALMEYDVGAHELSVMDTPYQGWQDRLALMAADEDGMLLFAGVWESKLHLWSVEAGAEAWARFRVIELKALLPTRTLSKVSVVGAVEGASVIFLETPAGLFMVDLNSGESKKVYGKVFFLKVVPYTSFYTGVLQGH